MLHEVRMQHYIGMSPTCEIGLWSHAIWKYKVVLFVCRLWDNKNNMFITSEAQTFRTRDTLKYLSLSFAHPVLSVCYPCAERRVHCSVSSLKSNMYCFSITSPCSQCTYPWSQPLASVTYNIAPPQPEALFMPLLAFLKPLYLLSVYASSSAVQEKHRDPRGQLDLPHHDA